MANLGALRDIVLDNLQRVAGDSLVQGTNVDRWINHCIRKVIATRHNWDAMEATYTINTIAGQELYNFPSSETKDVKQIAIRLSATDFFSPLREDSEDQLDQNIPAARMTGVPVAWCRTGHAFRLRPAPSVSTYSIRARVWNYPILLVDDADTNYWTDEHDDLVEDLATALGYRWTGDFERYGSLWQVAMAELGERIANDAKRLRPSRQTVAPGRCAGKPASSAGTRLGEAGAYRQYP